MSFLSDYRPKFACVFFIQNDSARKIFNPLEARQKSLSVMLHLRMVIPVRNTFVELFRKRMDIVWLVNCPFHQVFTEWKILDFSKLKAFADDLSKLKAFADDKLNVVEMVVIIYESVENLVGKGENADYQHFLHFPQGFPKGYFPRVFKTWVCKNCCSHGLLVKALLVQSKRSEVLIPLED